MSTVEDGIIQHLSVSQVMAFNADEYGGCNRRWYFRRVMHLEEPFTGAQKKGVEIHDRLKHYMRTGQDVLGRHERAALHLIPDASDAAVRARVLAEWGFDDKPQPDTDGAPWFDPATSMLRAAGVPFVGFMDLVDPRGDVITVTDYKTTGDVDKASKAPDTAQMIGYGHWAALKFPGVRQVETRFLFISTKAPRAEERKLVFSVDELRTRWQSVEQVVERMKAVASAPTVEEVAGSPQACRAWNRVCPYASRCSAFPSFFAVPSTSPTQGGNNMSLLETLRAKAAGNAAPVTAAPTPSKMAIIDIVSTPTPVADTPTQAPTSPGRVVIPAGIFPPGAFAVGARLPSGDRVVVEVLPDGALVTEVNTATTTAAPVEVAPPAPAPEPVEPPAEPKRGRGRPKGSKNAPAAPVQATETATPAPVQAASAGGHVIITAPTTGPAPVTTGPAYLGTYIANRVKDIARQFNAFDIRSSNHDALGFGKWRGVLAASVLDSPPAPGAYVVDSGGEFTTVALEALMPVAAELGLTIYIDCAPIAPGVVLG